MKSRKKPRKFAVRLREFSFLAGKNSADNGTFLPKCGVRLPAFKGGCHLWLTMF
jgi:hypothetical protein